MSVSSLRAKRALARRLRTLPVVRAALEAGAISLDAAQQIARVATKQTEPLWVERAKCRTAKHLREEVELAEVVARRAGQGGCLPPSEEQMKAYFGIERAIASGQAFAEAAQAPKAGQVGEASAVVHRQMSEGQAASVTRLAGDPPVDNAQADGTRPEGAQTGACQADNLSPSGAPPPADAPQSDESDNMHRASAGSQLPPLSTGQPSRPESGAREASAMEQRHSSNRLRSWHSSLVASAALLRAHLGLSGAASGPAPALGEPAAGIAGRQMSGESGAGPAGAFDELVQGLLDRGSDSASASPRLDPMGSQETSSSPTCTKGGPQRRACSRPKLDSWCCGAAQKQTAASLCALPVFALRSQHRRAAWGPATGAQRVVSISPVLRASRS